jgi:hypothetical protein
MSSRKWRGVSAWLVAIGLASFAGICLAGPKDAAKKSAKSKPATTKFAGGDETKEISPQVEVYVPSVARLAAEVKRSRTAQLYRALSGLIEMPVDETGEGIDGQAVMALLKKTMSWADTSVSIFTYTQDREGRPRWIVRLDWPLDDLRRRVGEILNDDAAKKILKDIELKRQKDGSYQIESPDTVLAVLSATTGGSMLASTAGLEPPERAFGQKPQDKKQTTTSLVYCLLNLAGEDEEQGDSTFSQIAGVSDIRYAASVSEDGLWSERFNIRWNPFVGMALKALFKKAGESFECPTEAFAVAAIHLGMAEGMADGITGLPTGTIGSRADGEFAVALVPGTGFLPIPDIFYQFHARGTDKIMKEIRTAMRKDAKKRKEDDRPPVWREEKVDDRVVFWHDPSVDRAGSLSLMNYRTVIFFGKKGDEADDEAEGPLIIAQTTTWAEDAVRRWDELSARASRRMRVPTSDKVHWQAVIRWREIYELAAPYLTLAAGLGSESAAAPDAEELGDALADSTINIQVLYSGLDARHTGPIPFGAAYVPAVTAMSLAETSGAGTEADRERIACRNLRVLHHHAKLFKKDYGRWPATVAELDGYVDFSSHPDLLKLQPKDEGFLGEFAALFTPDGKKKASEDQEEEESDINDSLYEIDWSEKDWKLKMRANEFLNFATIYVDAEGEIHRVEKKDSKGKKVTNKLARG